MTIDKEMRFGVVAINKGYVTPEQVIEALNIQVKEDISAGKHRKLGMILLGQGYIIQSQIDEVLRELKQQAGN
ncbi:MAG: hypothetical protein JXA35_00725 [Deltaproteobacteria bacterium]|nr:hypothetical protein [Deltaproteobacteria bacterium]